MIEYISNSKAETVAFAKSLVPKLVNGDIIFFDGGLGMGKTAFCQGLCDGLGINATVTSPTFAIVNEYEDGAGRTIYHFDFYRIKSVAEVYNMGYEEYLYSDAYCFMEWPELVEELLPEECVRVDIKEESDGTRTLKITYRE